MITCPADGRSSPASSAKSVDLPLPDGPMIATNSPRAIERLTSSTTVIVLSPERKRRVSPRISTIEFDSIILASHPRNVRTRSAMIHVEHSATRVGRRIVASSAQPCPDRYRDLLQECQKPHEPSSRASSLRLPSSSLRCPVSGVNRISRPPWSDPLQPPLPRHPPPARRA